jgi:protein subunit release factor B
MAVFLHQFEHELEEKFVTAGGPGGQNVNKVASAVQLRFNIKTSHAFNDEQKWMIRRALATRINGAGEAEEAREDQAEPCAEGTTPGGQGQAIGDQAQSWPDRPRLMRPSRTVQILH